MIPNSATAVPSTTFPRTHEAFLSLTEQASNQIAVSRAYIAPLGGKPASPTSVQLQFALAEGHDAVGKLFRASATLGDEIPSHWTTKAATDVQTALGEIERMASGKAADTGFAVATFDQAVHDISRGRRLLISPPSTDVHDGS